MDKQQTTNTSPKQATTCGEACEVYSRVTGYFRPVSNWNKGKQEEFNNRKMFEVNGEKK